MVCIKESYRMDFRIESISSLPESEYMLPNLMNLIVSSPGFN